jgi:Acetyltransferase (GNAT) domain
MNRTFGLSARAEVRQDSFQILYEYPDETSERLWRECLLNGDMPTHFTAPEFFFEPRAAGERPFAILLLDPASVSRRVIGVITGIQKDQFVTSGRIGTPQICLDKSADPQSVGTVLAQSLRAVGKSAELITAYLWFPLHSIRIQGFGEGETSGTAMLDLSGGPEVTFSRLKGRSQIRHAVKSGVTVRQAAPEEVLAYYAVLKTWSEATRLPCPSLEFERTLFRLTHNRRLFVAVYEGKIIAGTPVRFHPGTIAEYAWNCSLPEYRHLRPNDLLQWRIIEWACQEGIHTYLFGATHPFLLKYSDRVIPTYRYTLDRTLLKKYDLKDGLMHAAYETYRRFPEGVKDTVRRLRG